MAERGRRGQGEPPHRAAGPQRRRVVGTLEPAGLPRAGQEEARVPEPDLKVLGVDLTLLQTALWPLPAAGETLASAAAYCFTHLSLQEFVAAAYFYCSTSKRAIFDLFTEGWRVLAPAGLPHTLPEARPRAMQSPKRTGGSKRLPAIPLRPLVPEGPTLCWLAPC